MSTGRRCQPCIDQKRSTASGSTSGKPRRNQRAEGRPGRVVVDHERRAPAAYDPVELAQAGLRAGAEEVGPARVRHVDRRVGQGERLGAALEDADVGQRARTTTGERDERRVRLDADHLRRGPGPQREVEAAAAADVEDRAPGPVADLAHRGGDAAVGVGGAVLELVQLGGVPDVGGRGARRSQMPHQAVGGLELDGDDAGGAVGGDPLDLHVLERRLDGLAEPLADPLRVAGDLQAGEGEVAGRAVARVEVGGATATG